MATLEEAVTSALTFLRAATGVMPQIGARKPNTEPQLGALPRRNLVLGNQTESRNLELCRDAHSLNLVLGKQHRAAQLGTLPSRNLVLGNQTQSLNLGSGTKHRATTRCSANPLLGIPKLGSFAADFHTGHLTPLEQTLRWTDPKKNKMQLRLKKSPKAE